MGVFAAAFFITIGLFIYVQFLKRKFVKEKVPGSAKKTTKGGRQK